MVLTLNVSEAIRQDCSSSDDTAYVVLTLSVSEKRSIRLMVERTCSVVRQNKPSWLVPAKHFPHEVLCHPKILSGNAAPCR